MNLDEDIEDFDYDQVDNENFEPVAKGVLTAGIQIRNLKKTYKTGFPRKTVGFGYKFRYNSTQINISFLSLRPYYSMIDGASFERDITGFVQRTNNSLAGSQWCWENHTHVYPNRYELYLLTRKRIHSCFSLCTSR